jgi:hypothetical protein
MIQDAGLGGRLGLLEAWASLLLERPEGGPLTNGDLLVA